MLWPYNIGERLLHDTIDRRLHFGRQTAIAQAVNCQDVSALASGNRDTLPGNSGHRGRSSSRNRHARYHNVYFVGASTRPGTGVPTALVSARLVAERIMEDHALRTPYTV